MAAPFTVTPLMGVDLNSKTLAADVGPSSGAEDAPALGTLVQASNGRAFVYAQADGTINASDTDCAVNATTFIASASGGSYTSPAVALAVGDRAWFSKASV
jgi:hypothetical protein